jgi:signal transduction histidine kinase
MRATVREQASQRIHSYWRSRGWQLVLGEVILWAAAHQRDVENPAAHGFAAGLIGVAYVLGVFRRIDTFWMSATVLLFMLQGMLMSGLGAVTALTYVLPYTFAAMMLSGRRRIFVQAWCIIAFWNSLLYEALPSFPQLDTPRFMLVSYNILLAAFTFQTLRFLNQLGIELNTTSVAEEVRGQSQQFLARVSHELRTPLNSVLGFAKMLNRSDLTDKQAAYLTQVIDEGEQLNRLVSDLLDSAQLSTGKLTLNKAPCNVNEICETVANEHRPQVKSGVALTIHLQPDLPPLEADQVRLRQAVANLVGNACKYTEQGAIELSTRQREQSILIAIRDTGVGIPEDQQKLVFVPFVQLDGQKVGVGLGLDIALQLVNLHGGELHLESTVGQGSTFTIELPMS